MFRIFLVCCLSYFASISDAGVAPFIAPCKLDDKACLVSSSQAAVPIVVAGIHEFGVEKMDPIHLQTINSDTEKLKLTFNNVEVSGLSKCKILRVELNNDQSSLTFVLETPFVATGHYAANGEAIVHVEGNGDFKLETEKIELSIQSGLTIKDGSDGQKHWHVHSFDFTYSLKDKIHMFFGNLFNGEDKEKADAVLALLDHSWKEMTDQFGKGIIKEFIEKIKNNINKIFEAVPLNELYKS